MIHKHYIYAGVYIGLYPTIEDYCIIGVPPKGYKEGEVETIIGNSAHLRSHTVIYAGNRIGENFTTGNKVNIREYNKIGNKVTVGTLTVIEHHVQIGDNVRIHSQAFIPEYSILEDDVYIGPNVVLTNAKYPFVPNSKETLKGPILKQNAKVGANATILPGIIIGKNALVGAGSVVTKNVADDSVVAGNPARVINTIKNLPY